jgi:hypothetical protein
MMLPKNEISPPDMAGEVPMTMIRFDVDPVARRRYEVWPLDVVMDIYPEAAEDPRPDDELFCVVGDDGALYAYVDDDSETRRDLFSRARGAGMPLAFCKRENDLIETGVDWLDRRPGWERHSDFHRLGAELGREVMAAAVEEMHGRRMEAGAPSA